MIWTFLRRVFAFAFTKFGVRIDLVYALVSIICSFFLGSGDKPMGDLTTHDIAIITAWILAVYLGLRLLGGCYWTWKESETALIAANVRLAAPAQKIAESMADHRAARLAELSSLIPKVMVHMATGGTEQDVNTTGRRLAELSHEVSFDMALKGQIEPFLDHIRNYKKDEAWKNELFSRGAVVVQYLHSIGVT